jgi:excisionase family DNA binding protein
MKRTAGDDGGLMSIDQVAEQLGLHVRTVRRYVRDGRLRAARIGKQYRVSREALDALTGETNVAAVAAATAVAAPEAGARHIEVSSIVQVDGVDIEAAGRVTTALLAAAKGRPDTPDPLRIDTIFDRERARLKVILNGSPRTTASLLKFITAYLEA